MTDLQKYRSWLESLHQSALDKLSDCTDLDEQLLHVDVVLRLSHSLDSLHQFDLISIKKGA